jgi:hypothetical protein
MLFAAILLDGAALSTAHAAVARARTGLMAADGLGQGVSGAWCLTISGALKIEQ